jgi:hypothetical protein
MRYAPLAPVIRSRSLELEASSDNLQYTAGDVVRINIPSIGRSYLEPESSYLHFNVRNTSTTNALAATAADLDGSVYSLFSKVEVYSGVSASTLLESTDNCHILMSMLMDLHVGQDERTTSFSLLAGTSTTTMRGGRTLAASANQTFSISLPSFLGLFGSKAVPIAGGLTVFLTLTPAAQCLVTANANDIPGYQVNQVRFCASIIELDPMADSVLLKSYGGSALSLPIIRWQSYTATQPASQRTNSILIGCSASSVKSIIGTARPSATISAPNVAAIQQRIRNNLTEFQARIGSALIPPNRVRTEAQAYAHLLKSRHLLSMVGTQGLISAVNYWSDTGGNSAWSWGLDLDVFTGRSDSISSGINTNGVQMFIDQVYALDPVAALQHIFCELNAIILCSPTGEMSVAF